MIDIKVRILVLLAILISLIFVSATNGAEMSNGTTAVLTLSENPSTVGAEVACNGSGFEPNDALQVTQQNPESLFFFGTTTDADGNVFFTVPTDVVGDVDVKVYESLHGNKYKLVAEIVLTVN